jgi:UV DNA damage endonuclease
MRSRPVSLAPALGLVCITHGPEVRFRTITRKRFLSLSHNAREDALLSIYRDNVASLYRAIEFCHQHGIQLYRCTSAGFPMLDDPVGRRVLKRLRHDMKPFSASASRLGVRVLMHPDQYVVLNSDSPQVIRQSIGIMKCHALVFDLLSLPRSTWSCMILHGGKSGAGARLVQTIRQLPAAIRTRLVLENDERAFGAAEILDICRETGVPMVFDAHHHVIHDRLDSFGHPSIARFTADARETWPDPQWQIVHLSNGRESARDPKHSDLITTVPSAYAHASWIEVEAKHKEAAIADLRQWWPAVAGLNRPTAARAGRLPVQRG